MGVKNLENDLSIVFNPECDKGLHVLKNSCPTSIVLSSHQWWASFIPNKTPFTFVTELKRNGILNINAAKKEMLVIGHGHKGDGKSYRTLSS